MGDKMSWKIIKGYIKEFFSLNDDIVATMMILIVFAFIAGITLLFMSSIHNNWNIDDVAFSVFFGTFVTAGVVKMAYDKTGINNNKINED